MSRATETRDPVVDALLTDDEKRAYDAKVESLLIRHKFLEAVDRAREQRGMTKAQLAANAGMEGSSVRRMLTSSEANPTLDNFGLMIATVGIKVEMTLPSGDRVAINP